MKLVLIGAGGHSRSCLDVALTSGWEVAGFLDPKPEATIFDFTRLGGDEWLDNLGSRKNDYSFHVAVGQIKGADVRRKIFNDILQRQLPIATLIALDASVSKFAQIGQGCTIHHHAIINAATSISSNCIINTSAVIEHDVTVGAHSHISTGAILNGGVQIGDGCMIGSRAVILPGLKLASNTIIGAGAVVTKSIESAGTWMGVPARRVA
ncbi:acetyltransferase [Chitinibacter tainanensis]|uniref:acetyltransferase n=1 Tax=Chitinibacter tainanensis TaxID=230667 RepID=UPI0023538885|nr:acetyltransferase [Chitinibacter tainanensis]